MLAGGFFQRGQAFVHSRGDDAKIGQVFIHEQEKNMCLQFFSAQGFGEGRFLKAVRFAKKALDAVAVDGPFKMPFGGGYAY